MRPKKTDSEHATHSAPNYWIIAVTVIIGVISGFILILAINLTSDVQILPTSKQSTVFYDIHKREYTRIFVENRLEAPLQSIPDNLKKAIVNVEDVRFFEHSGIDFRSIARAIWVDIRGGGYIEGGSTITQQLARNVLLSQKKAITRKIQEVFLAMKLERNYTKEEILERYLNQIYFGHGTYGVEAASRLYFGKSVTRLELHQIALLAGLPKSPNGFSPYQNPEAAKSRRAVVLAQMAKYGSISEEQEEFYNNKPLDVIPLEGSKRKAAYFVDYIVQKLKGTIDEESLYTGGYQIYTTIDPLAQEAADEAVASLTGGEADANGILQPQIALVAIDPRNGYIKAMIGGRDFGNTQLNRAVSAYRQPGSAMKPFVYTAAIDSKHYTPSTILTDEPLEYPMDNGKVWSPQNYDRQFRGEIPLRQALEQSINTVAIKLVEDIGPSKIVSFAKQMGLSSLIVTGKINDLNLGALALGGLTKGVSPLEMATAYAPLANQGLSVEPIAVLEVRDADGHVIFEERTRKKVVISEATAYLVTDMLRGVIMRGTGRGAMLDRPAAGKTGTTNDNTNAWFVGYTPDLLATVWIGNDAQNKPIQLNGAYIGSGRAARVWNVFMRKALSKTSPSDFVPPAGVVTGVEICTASGLLASPDCPEISYESYLSGTEPTEVCTMHSSPYPPFFEDDSSIEPFPGASPISPDTSVPENSGAQPALPETTPTPKPQVPHQSQGPKRRIIVKICTESGLLASPYCPESLTAVEIFTEGEEPTEYCNIHKPAQ